MLTSDEAEFERLINVLAVQFNVEASPTLVSVYWMGLDDITIEDLRRAVRTLLKSSRFMPKVVDIREATGQLTPDARATLAATELRDAIGRHGSYRSVRFTDPYITAAVRRLGGWTEVATAETEKLPFLLKDFERIYRALLASGLSDGDADALPGRHELSNLASGYAHEASPELIGGPPAKRMPPRRVDQRKEIAGGVTAPPEAMEAIQRLLSKTVQP